jgi:hypothetical protein
MYCVFHHLLTHSFAARGVSALVTRAFVPFVPKSGILPAALIRYVKLQGVESHIGWHVGYLLDMTDEPFVAQFHMTLMNKSKYLAIMSRDLC